MEKFKYTLGVDALNPQFGKLPVGKFRVRLELAQLNTSQSMMTKGDDFYNVEFTVLKVFNKTPRYEVEHKPVPAGTPNAFLVDASEGDRRSHRLNMKWPASLGAATRFTMALAGIDPSDKTALKAAVLSKAEAEYNNVTYERLGVVDGNGRPLAGSAVEGGPVDWTIRWRDTYADDANPARGIVLDVAVSELITKTNKQLIFPHTWFPVSAKEDAGGTAP